MMLYLFPSLYGHWWSVTYVIPVGLYFWLPVCFPVFLFVCLLLCIVIGHLWQMFALDVCPIWGQALVVVWLSVYMRVCLCVFCVYLLVCYSVCLYFCLSVSLFVWPLVICDRCLLWMTEQLQAGLAFVWLSVHMCVCLYVFLYTC